MRTRPTNNTPTDQKKKYEAHKTANAAVKQLRACKQYFTAFVIAFALLEDRVRALDFVGREQGVVPPPTSVRRRRDWKDIVQRLHRAEIIEMDVRDELMNLADMRNKLIHSAHYNLDRVEDAHVKRVIAKQRLLAKIVLNLNKGSKARL
jgi:hypothetical protein